MDGLGVNAEAGEGHVRSVISVIGMLRQLLLRLEFGWQKFLVDKH